MENAEFIEIIREHRSLIYKVCRVYCKSASDMQDLEQEILINLWSSMDRFDGRVKLSTWMYRVSVNTAIMFYRKSSRYRRRHLLTDSPILERAETPNTDETESQLNHLYHAIGELKDHDKALIMLYLDGVNQSEIAEIIGISQTNVATRIGRIKNRLKKRILTSKTR